jgi:hypothetical protein
VKHSTQKEARIIDTLEPVMSSHRLIVDQRVIQKDFDTAKDIKYSLFYQMTRITRDKGAIVHDDRLDALAIAVAYWTESMGRDNNKAAQDVRSVALDKELKGFMQTIKGSSSKQTTWMSRA